MFSQTNGKCVLVFMSMQQIHSTSFCRCNLITNAFIPLATYSTCRHIYHFCFLKSNKNGEFRWSKVAFHWFCHYVSLGVRVRGAFNCIIIIYVESRIWQTFAFCKIFLNNFFHNTRQSNCCTRPRIKEWKILCGVAIVDLGDFWHWRHCKQWTAHLLFKMMSTIADH